MNNGGTFVSVSGIELDKRVWEAKGEAKGIVQLVHGMAEHIDRYADTAAKLNAAGYTVVGHTQLGHGSHAKVLGYIEGGWDALIEDVHALRLAMQKSHPDLPYFLLGHSMGSFVARTYCLKYEKGLKGVIFSGTGHFDKAIVSVGDTIAKMQCALGMAKKPSKLIDKMNFASNNRCFPNPRTAFDWLSRDEKQVDAYIADPYCGFVFTAQGYRCLFSGLKRLYPDKLGTMDVSVPVLLFSGDHDPVGKNGEGVHQVADELTAAGVADVTVRLYSEGRHEMFNETNSDEVVEDLAAWLDRVRMRSDV